MSSPTQNTLDRRDVMVPRRYRYNVAALIASVPMLYFWFLNTTPSATIIGAIGAGLLCASTTVDHARPRPFWNLLFVESSKPLVMCGLFLLSLQKAAAFPQWEPTAFQAGSLPVVIFAFAFLLVAAWIAWACGESERQASSAEGSL